MKRQVVLAGVVSVCASAAQTAEIFDRPDLYDRKLEQAVMTIVAGKIGDIRGGFDYDHAAVPVVIDPVATGSLPPRPGNLTVIAAPTDPLQPN